LLVLKYVFSYFGTTGLGQLYY